MPEYIKFSQVILSELGLVASVTVAVVAWFVSRHTIVKALALGWVAFFTLFFTFLLGTGAPNTVYLFADGRQLSLENLTRAEFAVCSLALVVMTGSLFGKIFDFFGSR